MDIRSRAVFDFCAPIFWSAFSFSLFVLCSALSKLVSRAADGGITALHLAALNGHLDCVQLLLDLLADVSATTFHYGTAIDLIGLVIFSNFLLERVEFSFIWMCFQVRQFSAVAYTEPSYHLMAFLGFSTGAGSTPLHYAACGGSLPCCQVCIYPQNWL